MKSTAPAFMSCHLKNTIRKKERERGQGEEGRKKSMAQSFSFCLLQSVIEMENQMNGEQIIVLSIFPGCPTRVSGEWSRGRDMTRTKCEIEQLGGNKSVLTTKSDQHVPGATCISPLRVCLQAERADWRIFISYPSLLMSLSNISLRNFSGNVKVSLDDHCCHCSTVITWLEDTCCGKATDLDELKML